MVCYCIKHDHTYTVNQGMNYAKRRKELCPLCYNKDPFDRHTFPVWLNEVAPAWELLSPYVGIHDKLKLRCGLCGLSSEIKANVLVKDTQCVCNYKGPVQQEKYINPRLRFNERDLDDWKHNNPLLYRKIVKEGGVKWLKYQYRYKYMNERTMLYILKLYLPYFNKYNILDGWMTFVKIHPRLFWTLHSTDRLRWFKRHFFRMSGLKPTILPTLYKYKTFKGLSCLIVQN